MTRTSIFAISLALMGLAGCRGQTSTQPPIHLNPNMDTQPKYKAQSRSAFFADGRTMRTPPEGTLMQGHLREDDALSTGKLGDAYVQSIPLPVDEALMARGQARFNIYCAPCHDQTGSGHGRVVSYGLVPPPTYHQDRIRQMPDGEIFNVITHGVRTMPSYAYQIPEHDRWAIVAYVRALQRSELATLEDIPEQQRTAVK